jgi:hypothetical protein
LNVIRRALSLVHIADPFWLYSRQYPRNALPPESIRALVSDFLHETYPGSIERQYPDKWDCGEGSSLSTHVSKLFLASIDDFNSSHRMLALCCFAFCNSTPLINTLLSYKKNPYGLLTLKVTHTLTHKKKPHHIK